MAEPTRPEDCPEPFWHETHRYCPACSWTEPVEPAPPTPWRALRDRLNERLTMARQVLDEAGHGSVAVLVPVEEVLIWMDEIEAGR